MIKRSVTKTKRTGLLARARAIILYILILILGVGPEKLPGLSRNVPTHLGHTKGQNLKQ